MHGVCSREPQDHGPQTSKRQAVGGVVFRTRECFGGRCQGKAQVVEFGRPFGANGSLFDGLAAVGSHLGKGRFFFDAKIAPEGQIGGNARGRGPGKGVQNPAFSGRRCQQKTHQEGQSFLRRVLSEGFFPRRDGGDSPNIRHLMPPVELFHQLVIEKVGLFLVLSRPNDKFRGIREVAAGDIGRRVGFDPRDDVQNLETQFIEGV